MAKNDDKIKELLSVIETKRTALGTKPRMTLKTNGLLKMKDKTVNINTVNSLTECIRIVADIIDVRDSFSKAAELLDIETFELPKVNGFSAEDWIEDFKLKVKIILWAVEDKKIKALESKLKDLRSNDLKTADALDDIEGALK